MRQSIVVITNKQKLFICFVSIVFILLIALFVSTLNFPKEIKTINSGLESILSLENENTYLKDIISTIIPAENKVLYEDINRNVKSGYDAVNTTGFKAAEVLSKGKNLEYITAFIDENYQRPIYSDNWKQAYYKGWLYLPDKVVASRHSLFTYEGSASNIFDLEGNLGFYPNTAIDTQNYLNLLIYNFDLDNVTLLGNQLAISGTPVKKGVQIISVKSEQVYQASSDTGNLLVQLCTPFGYEVDFQNIQFPYTESKSKKAANTNYSLEEDSVDKSVQNKLLKQELSYYISDSASTIYFQRNGSYKTSDVFSTNIDINNAIENSSSLKYYISYEDAKYQRPAYHPSWKENFDKEWCYIPRKMYLNMKKLFVLPSDRDIANDLCGELGFFEKRPQIEKGETGLLVYNFSVQSVRVYENNIIVSGIPSRSGVQVVNIPKSNLSGYNEYAVRLLTKDLCELDLDVLGTAK